ncbi:MAG: ABC transporter permease [Campylobacterales bacterium]|nr:ABC transporter permease [Campylobacterales bacterium]
MGIVVSVIAVIVMISINEGNKLTLLQSIRDYGMQTIRIAIDDTHVTHHRRGFSMHDIQHIKAILSEKGIILPLLASKNMPYSLQQYSAQANLYQCSELFFDVEQLHLLRGRPILAYDVENAVNAAIISESIANRYSVDIGDFISIRRSIYQIVGISDTNAMQGDFVILPLSKQTLFSDTFFYNRLVIRVFDTSHILELYSQIQLYFNEIGIPREALEYLVPAQMVEQEENAQKQLNLVLFMVALMSMLSGGINIMNIMLSNLAQQTREIGLKMALGATAERIRRGMLLHAVILTSCAALLGSIAGYGILLLLSLHGSVPIYFSQKAFLIAGFMAVFSGLLFGLYPALRASQIAPMSALKEY